MPTCSMIGAHQRQGAQLRVAVGEGVAPSCRRTTARRPICSGGAAACATPAQAQAPACSRRAALPALGLALLAAAAPSRPARAEAEEDGSAAGAPAPSPAGLEFTSYTSPEQRYTFSLPAGWEQVNKAGADVLFRDPERKSTTVGVTVYPVMIASLEEFGDLAAVGKRLLDAERAKESTLGVEMLSQQQRRLGASGISVYDYCYQLETTRGGKQIFNSVTVAGRKLYILNGSLSCAKGEGGSGSSSVCSTDAAAVLQQVAQSFQVQ